jgi:glutathione S-transferase
MPVRPTLTYFDLRGRAEPIRLMLHARGGDFEDRRIMDPEEWSRLKPTLPFGSLPLYETGELAIAQSHAIFRHLARSFGWLGSNPTQDALLDVTQEALAEAQEDLWRFAWLDRYHEKMDRYATQTLIPRLDRLQAWLRRDGRSDDFWVGQLPTHVDFIAFCYLDELDAFFPAVLDRFEHLAAFRRHIEAMPGIAEYIASEDRPIVFGMGIRGPKVDRRKPIPEGARFENPWTNPIPLE